MSPRPGSNSAPQPWSDADFLPVEAILRQRTYGGIMSPQRLGLIRSRLQERLRARGFPSFTRFHERELNGRADSPGMQLLIDLTTINHSSFFRESSTLEALADHLVERLRQRHPGGPPVRVWSAGCAAGQEPYSLAMLVAEHAPTLTPEGLEIRASDISLGVTNDAARAIYEERVVEEIPPERLRRFFLRGRDAKRGTYRIVPEIRRVVTFQQFDLQAPDWPVPDGLDAILCRNVAIYFTEPERLALLDRLADHLRPGGWLVVGNAEILPERPGRLRKIGPSTFGRVASP